MTTASLKLEQRARALATSARHRLGLERTRDDRGLLIQGIGAIHAQKAARHTFRHLWDAEVSVFSQWGEDGILDLLCDSIDLARPKALELGVGNYTECNTRFLAEHRCASVVAVDGRDDLSSTIDSLPLSWRTTVWGLEQWITPENVTAICEQATHFMDGLDLLSLDIDGNDYWVAERIELEGVRLVVVEYNPVFGTEAVTVPRDDRFDRSQAHFSHLYYGASLRAFVDLFAGRGFRFVGTNRACTNAFFVREDQVDLGDLVLPDPADLDRYVDGRVRESRSSDGSLSRLAGESRRELIGHLPVVRLPGRESTSIIDLF